MPSKSPEVRRAAYLRNREKTLAKMALYREANRELLAAKARLYYKENTEARKAAQREYVARNREAVAARDRKYVAANIEAVRERRRVYMAERRARDPIFKLQMNLRCRLNMAFRGKAKTGSAVQLLGCSGEHARAHIERQFAPGMSWENWGAWHIDHRRPLSAFDLHDPVQLAAACHYTNLQPLWAAANISKGASIIQEAANV